MRVLGTSLWPQSNSASRHDPVRICDHEALRRPKGRLVAAVGKDLMTVTSNRSAWWTARPTSTVVVTVRRPAARLTIRQRSQVLAQWPKDDG